MTKIKNVMQRATVVMAAVAMMVVAGTTWLGSGPALAAPATVTAAAATTSDYDVDRPAKRAGKTVSGKLNINTATEDQLILLPGVGPSKAERVVSWRAKHGAFKRVADLRHVKGFGYKTIKKLEPFLDIKGDNTLKAE